MNPYPITWKTIVVGSTLVIGGAAVGGGAAWWATRAPEPTPDPVEQCTAEKARIRDLSADITTFDAQIAAKQKSLDAALRQIKIAKTATTNVQADLAGCEAVQMELSAELLRLGWLDARFGHLAGEYPSRHWWVDGSVTFCYGRPVEVEP